VNGFSNHGKDVWAVLTADFGCIKTSGGDFDKSIGHRDTACSNGFR